MKTILLFCLLCAPGLLRAVTTITEGRSFAHGANLGWIDLRGDVAGGASVGEFICQGWIYSANAGWITLGSGLPADGIRYGNATGEDSGVNVLTPAADSGTVVARLRGSAWSANLGWIEFEETGDPRVDLGTGALKGAAYSANAGWITLDGGDVDVQTGSLAAAADTDADGIPDAWERLHAGNLTQMSLVTDSDADGVSDAGEYQADTNPLDGSDFLDILSFIAPRQLVPGGPLVADISWTSRPSRRYVVQASSALLAAWSARTGPVLALSGTSTSAAFPNPAGERSFYRVTPAPLLPVTPP